MKKGDWTRDERLLARWNAAIAAAGIRKPRLILDKTGWPVKGYGEVVYEVANFRIKLVKDTGEDRVYVGPAAEAETLFWWSDFALAQGWRSLAHVIRRRDPFLLEDELREIDERFAAVEESMSAANLGKTKAAVAAAVEMRRRAYFDRL